MAITLLAKTYETNRPVTTRSDKVDSGQAELKLDVPLVDAAGKLLGADVTVSVSWSELPAGGRVKLEALVLDVLAFKGLLP